MLEQERSPHGVPGSYRATIESAFLEAKGKPSPVSLRAFAQHLGIGKTILSDVLAKKRHLSRENALRVARRLDFSPDEVRAMLSEIFQIEVAPKAISRATLDEDVFRAISDWYHYAILNLARLPRHRADAHWIANRLGITPLEARIAVKRLTRLGLLQEQRGKLVRLCGNLSTKGDIPSEAIRNFHRQTLRLAEDSLDSCPMEKRELTGVTVVLNPKRLTKAKRMIAQFRDEMSEFLTEGEGTEVYHFALQLFPMKKGKPR